MIAAKHLANWSIALLAPFNLSARTLYKSDTIIVPSLRATFSCKFSKSDCKEAAIRSFSVTLVLSSPTLRCNSYWPLGYTVNTMMIPLLII